MLLLSGNIIGLFHIISGPTATSPPWHAIGLAALSLSMLILNTSLHWIFYTFPKIYDVTPFTTLTTSRVAA